MAEFGSEFEARVYRALLKLGWQPEQIAAQVWIEGAAWRTGGQIDFVLYRPQPLPIQCHGNWWHRDRDQDFLENAAIMHKYGVEPVVIWEDQAMDEQQTLAIVSRLVGRG